jgi:biopolymer transport protein ExbD
VPIMNMFLVLIPFLLMSASFFHIRAINTSVPVHSQASEASTHTPVKEEPKVTVVVELKADQVRLTALSSNLSVEVLAELEKAFPKSIDSESSMASLAQYLAEVKDRFPASDTMLLIPDDGILYNEIVQVMDCARIREKRELFPNVVISASLG